MKREFTKMHGCGNDYIYFDCTKTPLENPEALAVKLSRQHFSIGGDGIIMVCPSKMADVKMRIFNNDGSEAKMCGNGIRCVAKFAYDKGIVPHKDMAIESASGVKYIKGVLDDSGAFCAATVDMGDAVTTPKNIPVNLSGDEIKMQKHAFSGYEYAITCVSMGNPHCVIFGDDPDKIELEKIGPIIENDPIFPDRVNVEFIKVQGKNHLKMRVWERGSGETLACGTGACASAYAAIMNGYCDDNTDIRVDLRGGTLTIRCDGGRVYMTGPCEVAFEGSVEI